MHTTQIKINSSSTHSYDYKAAITIAAAAPPTTHCALAVIIGIPPVEVAVPEPDALEPDALDLLEPVAEASDAVFVAEPEPVVPAGPAVIVTGTAVKTSWYSVPLTLVVSVETKVVSAADSFSV